MYDEKGKLGIFEIDKKESNIKPWKVINKKSLRKNKTQLNLLNGKNILMENKSINVGDTIIFEDGKIKDHYKFEKGALIYIMEGKKFGKVGIVQELEKKSITLKSMVAPTSKSVRTLGGQQRNAKLFCDCYQTRVRKIEYFLKYLPAITKEFGYSQLTKYRANGFRGVLQHWF